MARSNGWRLVLVACALALAAEARRGRAAEADSTTLDRMRLVADRSGVLSVEGGGVVPHLSVSGAAWLGFANDPLVLHRMDGQRVGSVVGDRVSGALAATVGIFDRAQLTLEVPVILDLIRALKAKKDRCILLVEHKMDVVRELSDRIVVLHNGQLVGDGAPAAVIASPVVQLAYLGGGAAEAGQRPGQDGSPSRPSPSERGISRNV
jgi:hypothetical protein